MPAGCSPGSEETGPVGHVTYDPVEDVLLEHHPSHKGPREARTAHPHDIEDCENLLENYFMQARHFA